MKLTEVLTTDRTGPEIKITTVSPPKGKQHRWEFTLPDGTRAYATHWFKTPEDAYAEGVRAWEQIQKQGIKRPLAAPLPSLSNKE